MLVTRGVTGFGTCPHTIEDERTILQVEAQASEMVIPVRIFNNNLHLRIHRLCWAYHQVTPSLIHQLQAVFSPSHIAFSCNFYWTLATGKEEIIEQELIKMLGRMLGNVLYNLPVFWVRIAESLKVIALINGISNTTCHFQSLLEEEVLRFFKCCVIYNQQVAMCLQINLIHIQLVRDGLPGRFQPREATRQQAKAHLQ